MAENGPPKKLVGGHEKLLRVSRFKIAMGILSISQENVGSTSWNHGLNWSHTLSNFLKLSALDENKMLCSLTSIVITNTSRN